LNHSCFVFVLLRGQGRPCPYDVCVNKIIQIIILFQNKSNPKNSFQKGLLQKKRKKVIILGTKERRKSSKGQIDQLIGWNHTW